jgi:hypothetical protein
VGLSQALYGNQDYAAALAIAAHARDQAIGLKKDDVLWRAFVAEARAQRRLEKADLAMEAAKSAVAVVERLASGFEESPVEPVAADTVGAFTMLAVLQAENGDAGNAFRTIERRHAHALRLALAPSEREIHRGMTGAERDEERRVTVDVTSLAAQIRSETQLPHPDSARIARLGEQLAAAKARRSATRDKLVARLPMLFVWRGLAGAADVAEALAPLGSPTPLIAQFVVGEDDLLVTITREREDARGGPLEQRAYVAHVDARTLTQRITHALEPATIRDAVAWRDAAAELVKLFPPNAWVAIAAASHVLIAPDDVLWHVPFEALPFEGGILGDRTAIRYIGSATSLLPLTDEPPKTSGAPLGIVSPELTTAEKDRMSATAPDWNVRSDTVPDVEGRVVANTLGSDPEAVMTGAAATEMAFRDRAPGASWLHIGAPFRVNNASPLFSPILLGGDAIASAADRDGMLEVREVFDLDLHARAALFTDGAALSMRGAAPALNIVRWAWRAAGVPAIVVPRWAADPAATRTLLEEFYKQIKEGRSVDDALQRAQGAVRVREDTRAPVFWAGWMVVGAPERTEGTKRAEKN